MCHPTISAANIDVYLLVVIYFLHKLITISHVHPPHTTCMFIVQRITHSTFPFHYRFVHLCIDARVQMLFGGLRVPCIEPQQTV
jgi:hypothetical protein